MKKITSLALVLVLIISVFGFTSCAGAVEVDTIDGSTPEEAYTRAIQRLDEIDKYYVNLDMKASMKLAIVEIPIMNIEGFYFYSYEGDNVHCGITDSAMEQMENADVADAVSGYEKEMWYVDGVCYVDTGSSLYKFESSYCPIENSQYERAVKELIDEGEGEFHCYKKGDLYYFTITNTDNSNMKFEVGADKETFTVYFDEKGFIQEINVRIELGGISILTLASRYFYGDDAEHVTAPANKEEFLNRSYW